jgi:hypothetical protein
VNAKLSQHLILLGICALVFYVIMLISGKLPLEVMPQFVVTAVIFMSSGHFMKKAARSMAREENEEENAKGNRKEADWPWLTTLLNWTAAFLIVGIMALLLMKPIGLSIVDAIKKSKGTEQYFSRSIP